MDRVITITPQGLMTGFLAVCAGISCIGAAIGWIIKAWTHFKKPSNDQNARLSALEEENRKYAEYFAADKRKLEALEEGNRVTQRALLALLSHGIDGNDIEGLRKAQTELTNHLIER